MSHPNLFDERRPVSSAVRLGTWIGTGRWVAMNAKAALGGVGIILLASCTGDAGSLPERNLVDLPMIIMENFPTPVPEAIQYGEFRQANGCLVLDLGGTEFTPVFLGRPAIDHHDANLVAEFRGNTVPLNRRVKVGGGPIAAPAITQKLDKIQTSYACRSNFFVISQ